MNSYKSALFIAITFLLTCSNTKTAEQQEEKQPARTIRYIIYSYCPDILKPVMIDIARGLNLPIPTDNQIITVEHQDPYGNSIGFKRIIEESKNTDWVCIAHYDKCPTVAKFTQSFGEKARTSSFHSIVFLDGYLYEVAHTAKLFDMLGGLRGRELDINFNVINHRIYNFYTEGDGSWDVPAIGQVDTSMTSLRRILPYTRGLKQGALPIVTFGQQAFAYLKGVNIKCFRIDQKGALSNFPFSESYGVTRYYSCPSEIVQIAAREIGRVITDIDNNFLINTDLSCILDNQSLVQGAADIIPDKNAQAPMVFINRPTAWDGRSLSQIIAAKKSYSWLTAGILGDEFRWEFEIAPDQAHLITRQIIIEANHNAGKNQQAPYCVPFLNDYRRRLLKGYTAHDYRWFLNTSSVANNPQKRTIAQIQNLQGRITPEEQAYCERRRPIVLDAMRAVGIDHKNKFPTIAVVASGGGIRAMLATAGFLRGLERAHLLPAVTYVCGLSGSTWAIAPWISTDINLAPYCNEMVNRVNAFGSLANAAKSIASQKTFSTRENEIKTVFGQSWTVVDGWGLFISNNLLLIQNMTLSQQANKIADGAKPFPVYTAVDTSIERDWFEFNPYVIGSIGRQLYIPSWSFGRIFLSGISQDFAPEQSLGYLLGIFGSAMGARITDVLNGAGLKNITDSKTNMTAAEIPNFYFGIPGILGNQNRMLNLVDAGADFNLPYPPISGKNPGRKADIIIFVDASGESNDTAGTQLRKTIEYAKKNNLNLPDLLERFATNEFTRANRIKSFNGNASDKVHAPTVIYMPIALDFSDDRDYPLSDVQLQLIEGFMRTHETLLRFYTNDNLLTQYPTSNFSYEPAKSNFLLDLMDLNIQLSQARIIAKIQEYINTMH